MQGGTGGGREKEGREGRKVEGGRERVGGEVEMERGKRMIEGKGKKGKEGGKEGR